MKSLQSVRLRILLLGYLYCTGSYRIDGFNVPPAGIDQPGIHPRSGHTANQQASATFHATILTSSSSSFIPATHIHTSVLCAVVSVACVSQAPARAFRRAPTVYAPNSTSSLVPTTVHRRTHKQTATRRSPFDFDNSTRSSDRFCLLACLPACCWTTAIQPLKILSTASNNFLAPASSSSASRNPLAVCNAFAIRHDPRLKHSNYRSI